MLIGQAYRAGQCVTYYIDKSILLTHVQVYLSVISMSLPPLPDSRVVGVSEDEHG